MRNRIALVSGLFILSLTSQSLAAQTSAGRSPRVVTTSRLVQIYAGLEAELNTALQKHDTAAIDRLLSDDFEARFPDPDKYPMPREDWLAKNTGTTNGPATLRLFAVKDLGSSRVVSFIMSHASGDSFVVDVWQDAGNGSWQLIERYASELKTGKS